MTTLRNLYVLACVVSLAAPSFAQGSPAGSIDEALGQCFDRQSALVPFSGVVMARKGTETFVRTAGFMDPGSQAPISPDTRFRLASVQKVLTRIAIGLLVERGKIQLDDAVGKYVRDLPADIAAVTIDQLLQHRSGVASLTRMTGENDQIFASAKTAHDLLPAIVKQPLSFRPGERQEYSNGGYFLLGAVIEDISGKTYGDFLDEAIFQPIGLASTSLVGDSRTAMPLSKMALRMQPAGAQGVLTTPLERRGTPAGNGVSTAGDLMKLGDALTSDRLLSKATRERIFPRGANEWRIGQSGGSLGTNTDFAAYPDTGWVFVMLSNYDPPAGEIMAEVLRGVISGKGCTPLSATDRPSPFRLQQPPPSAGSATSGS